MRAELVVLPVALALLFPLRLLIDGTAEQQRAGERAAPPSIFVTVPSPRLAPILALGHREALAAMLEVRTAIFLSRTMERFSRLEREQVSRLYATITALDPKDPGPWLRWSQFMFTLVGDGERAAEICVRGLEQVPEVHPRRWHLRFELAAIRLIQSATSSHDELRVARLREAGQHLLATTELPGLTPEQIKAYRGAAEAFERGAVPREAILQQKLEHLEQQARAQPDRAIREGIERQIAETRSSIKLLQLQSLVARRAGAGQPIERLEDLGVDLTDPLGVGYLLWEGGVVAPGVSAARLERELNLRLQDWRAQRPGERATMRDLGLSGVLGFVEVEIGVDAVVVRPKMR